MACTAGVKLGFVSNICDVKRQFIFYAITCKFHNCTINVVQFQFTMLTIFNIFNKYKTYTTMYILLTKTEK